METELFDPAEGRRLRDQGMAQAAEAEDRAGSWRLKARLWIRAQAPGTRITAEDVRKACGSPTRQNAMGTVFQAARRDGLLTLVDLGQAKRSSRHASKLPVWERTTRGPVVVEETPEEVRVIVEPDVPEALRPTE